MLSGDRDIRLNYRVGDRGLYMLHMWGQGMVSVDRWIRRPKPTLLITSVNQPFTVEVAKWYRLRVEQKGTRTKCLVDDQVVAEVDESPFAPPADEQDRPATWLTELTPASATNGSPVPVRADCFELAGQPLPLTLRGRRYAKGLSVHAPSVVTYRLAQTFTRLRAEVGVADTGSRFAGSVVCSVVADGKVLFTSAKLVGGGLTAPVDVDISGVRELTLRCADADDGNTSDDAVWAAARLLR